MDEIEKCLDTDPEELLWEHKHLLFTHFENLTAGPIKDKQQWVAEFEAERSVAYHVGKGTKVTLRTRYSHINYTQVVETVIVDKEGSLKWRRGKRI